MVALETPGIEENIIAPDFKLKGVDGNIYSLNDVRGEKGLLVMFICNHCPYVKAIKHKIVMDCNNLKRHGINAIAIMPNDTEQYPDDNFDNMKIFAKENNFPFPYVIDETQQVAKSYGAVCTPDFFGFNKDLELHYRGRLDASGINNNPSTERDLYNAMMQIAQLNKGPKVQYPSIGCSIKYRL